VLRLGSSELLSSEVITAKAEQSELGKMEVKGWHVRAPVPHGDQPTPMRMPYIPDFIEAL